MVHRLESSGGRESPARSTMALVLHWGHSSPLPPVHTLRKGGDMGREQVFSSTERHGVSVVQLRTGGDGSVHDGIHLVGEQISKLVHAQEEAFETDVGKSIVPL